MAFVLVGVTAIIATVVAGWFEVTAIGVGVVLLQAAAVARFAVRQATGLRRLA